MAALRTQRFFTCRCYFYGNYYIQDYDIHLQYNGNESDFLQENSEVLKEKGCESEESQHELLKTVTLEYERRSNLEKDGLERRKVIKMEYKPLHEEVYTLKEKYLHQKFLDAAHTAQQPDAQFTDLIEMLEKETASRVYRIPVFKPEFCKMFLEELDHFEESDMPKARPNTMNRSGIVLSELGFDEHFTNPLREKYLCPLAKILYPEWYGQGLDSHRAFTVKYEEENDLDLGFHYDNAEVTLNVSLGKVFEDGSLYFDTMRKENRLPVPVEVKHTVGEGVLHRGQQRHGAMPITSGERVNLIIWMRSSSVRNKLCPMCDRKPTLTPSVLYGDGFTEGVAEMCSLT